MSQTYPANAIGAPRIRDKKADLKIKWPIRRQAREIRMAMTACGFDSRASKVSDGDFAITATRATLLSAPSTLANRILGVTAPEYDKDCG